MNGAEIGATGLGKKEPNIGKREWEGSLILSALKHT